MQPRVAHMLNYYHRGIYYLIALFYTHLECWLLAAITVQKDLNFSFVVLAAALAAGGIVAADDLDPQPPCRRRPP